MTACHILLGRPWAYDREILHDGKLNKYTVNKDGKKIRLSPLPQAEVVSAQLLFKERREKKLREEQLRESSRVGQSELDSGTGSERKKSETTSEKRDLVLATQRKVDRNFANKPLLVLSMLQERSLSTKVPKVVPVDVTQCLQRKVTCSSIGIQQNQCLPPTRVNSGELSKQRPMDDQSKGLVSGSFSFSSVVFKSQFSKIVHQSARDESVLIVNYFGTFERGIREKELMFSITIQPPQKGKVEIEACLPLNDFENTSIVHSASNDSHFKEVNGFYPFTPLEKSTLPVYHFFSADRETRAKSIHDLRGKEGWSIQGKTEYYFKQGYERRSERRSESRSTVVFRPGDWAWVLVIDLVPFEFEESDSRTNPFEGEGNDANVNPKLCTNHPSQLSSASKVKEQPNAPNALFIWDPGGAGHGVK